MKVPILRIPFRDEDRRFINARIEDILVSGELTMGRYTEEFEDLFCEFVGSRFAIACSSGTAALELILRGLEIEGRDVVVPTNTFLATALAVVHSGNRVVFADCDPETLCLDPSDVESRVTEDTAAVILVHVGGMITNRVRDIQRLCNERGIFLIEDCAHAHGCSIDGERAGSLGIAGAFSFFPTKVLTTGEGGIVTTDDDALAHRLRSLRNHGKNPDLSGRISEIGSNFRMSEVTALIGVQQMRRAGHVIGERRRAALYYDSRLGAVPGVRPLSVPQNVDSTYYKYPIYLGEAIDRGLLKLNLKERQGVSLTGEVYADLCHAQPVWERYTYCGRRRLPSSVRCSRFPECGCDCPVGVFPGAEYISKRHVCLPVYPGLIDAELDHVVDALEIEVLRLAEAS